ncbi:30303_t:CDS:2 [Gigaspora margarita]|uniref:30303_t:CDS:1 n=1 Tax=Gigaspora margarita TaxID=4874 RepID=A0ABM8VVY2_GIGMA|nr:30303_t:CDS:2 [Gigaspora margarita]
MGKSRVKVACDHCRKVKLKCDNEPNPCTRCLVNGQNRFDIGLSMINGDQHLTNIEDCRYWLQLQSDMSLQENPGLQDFNVPMPFGEPYPTIDQQNAPQLLSQQNQSIESQYEVRNLNPEHNQQTAPQLLSQQNQSNESQYEVENLDHIQVHQFLNMQTLYEILQQFHHQ